MLLRLLLIASALTTVNLVGIAFSSITTAPLEPTTGGSGALDHLMACAPSRPEDDQDEDGEDRDEDGKPNRRSAHHRLA